MAALLTDRAIRRTTVRRECVADCNVGGNDYKRPSIGSARAGPAAAANVRSRT